MGPLDSAPQGCETWVLVFLFFSPGKKLRAKEISLSTKLCHTKEDVNEVTPFPICPENTCQWHFQLQLLL